MLEPARPYLLFHPKFVQKYGMDKWHYQMQRYEFEKKWWDNKECFAIDVNCNKFKLINLESIGKSWTIWNIFRSDMQTLLNVRYVFEPEGVMSFEAAREAYVECICTHRWWTASYETERQFRERNAKYTSMRELMEPVSLAGSALSKLRG